jgi:hypothetical protein
VLDMDPAERDAVGARARAAAPSVRTMQDATLDVYGTILRG